MNDRFPQFPPELLDQPVDVRKTYFKTKVVAHRSIVNAHTQLLSTLKHPIDGQIVMVIGAPGVGKTTVRKAMVRDLTTTFLAQHERHPGHLPVVGIELEAFQGGRFKWKHTRQAVLHALHEPFVEKKVTYTAQGTGEPGRSQMNSRLSADDLGGIMLTALAQRQPRALWFDEGQHLIKVSGAKGLLDQLDVMKSLANRSQIPTILFGTYEMNVLLGLSPQHDRRIHRIHIPRYKANQPEDVIEFQRVLLGLQKHMPFPVEPSLVEHWETFFQGSLGCIGLLKDWLYQSVGAALDREEPTLTPAMCEMWGKETDVLVDMLHRTADGERQFENKHSEGDLRALLGLPQNGTAEPKSVSRLRSGKPGTRKPVRDEVGVHVEP